MYLCGRRRARRNRRARCGNDARGRALRLSRRAQTSAEMGRKPLYFRAFGPLESARAAVIYGIMSNVLGRLLVFDISFLILGATWFRRGSRSRRSEERRVGKECRSRWSQSYYM